MADLVQLALAGPRALGAATGFLNRLPEVEDAIVRSARAVQRTLDDVLSQLRPIEAEIDGLRKAAGQLERQLGSTERRVLEIDARIDELNQAAGELIVVVARLEGTLEHLVDKVPGLSPKKAARRGREVVAAIRAAPEET